jgi:hypothetical protein
MRTSRFPILCISESHCTMFHSGSKASPQASHHRHLLKYRTSSTLLLDASYMHVII